MQVLRHLRDHVAQDSMSQARRLGWPELRILQIEADIQTQLSRDILDWC